MERLLGQLGQQQTRQAMKEAQAGEVGKALATAISTKPPAEQEEILSSQYNLTPEEAQLIITASKGVAPTSMYATDIARQEDAAKALQAIQMLLGDQ